MFIDNLKGINTDFSLNTNINSVSDNTYTDPFESFFDKAIGLLEETNIIQNDAEQKQIDFITGKSDDIIELSMAQTRATAAIQFTAQVTNGILNAYQEIMRINI